MNSHLTRIGTLIIAVVFLFTACNKDKKNAIHIEGKIFDPNTQEYVIGANVTIAASKLSSGGIFSSGYEDIATTTTDASGVFTFQFQESKVAGYQITIAKNHYFGYSLELNTSDIVAGTTFSPVYNLYPECFINMHVRNIIPVDSNDHIAYGFTTGWVGCYECCNNNTFQGHGKFYADTIICKTYGNQNVTLGYNVTKSGSTLLHAVTHYCPAFDTTTFDILY